MDFFLNKIETNAIFPFHVMCLNIISLCACIRTIVCMRQLKKKKKKN